MNNSDFLTLVIENFVGIIILVLAYKIYTSKCHTLFHNRFLTFETEWRSPPPLKQNALDLSIEDSTNTSQES